MKRDPVNKHDLVPTILSCNRYLKDEISIFLGPDVQGIVQKEKLNTCFKSISPKGNVFYASQQNMHFCPGIKPLL
jgi:hypothetical protein